MAVSDNLNSSVSALDAAANSLVSAVDAYVAAAGSFVGTTPDATVQAAADKINAIASALQAEMAKVAPKV